MKLINADHLPQPMVRAMQAGLRNRPPRWRKERIIHVTELMKPHWMLDLEEQHWEELEVEPEGAMAALSGQALSERLEQHASQEAGELAEHQLTTRLDTGTIDDACVWRLNGTPDLMAHNELGEVTIWDYKQCKSWKYVYRDFKDWTEQLNCYRWLRTRHDGAEVASLKIVAHIMDWMRGRLRTETRYPPQPLMVIELDIWPLEQTRGWIYERLSRLMHAPEPCTPEERWRRGEHWAVMRKGRKTAIKKCESEEEAESLKESLGGTHIEHRLGEDVRCENYCSVAKWCTARRMVG